MKLAAMRSKAHEVEGLLKAAANRNRLLILCELNGGERSVGALQKGVGLSQSALSQHLARLRADGLVATRREAQTIYYSLADGRIGRLIALLYDLYCSSPPRCGPAKRNPDKRPNARRER